jgi:hypothetical protein
MPVGYRLLLDSILVNLGKKRVGWWTTKENYGVTFARPSFIRKIRPYEP